MARRLGDSAVLIRLTTNRIYELNPTGARVWELVQSGAGVESMLEQLVQEFDVPPDAAKSQVEELMQELLTEGLIVPA